MHLISSANFDRDILNPALARASTLSDASTVLNDLVLQTELIYWVLIDLG